MLALLPASFAVLKAASQDRHQTNPPVEKKQQGWAFEEPALNGVVQLLLHLTPSRDSERYSGSTAQGSEGLAGLRGFPPHAPYLEGIAHPEALCPVVLLASC